ncbi:MAG: gluconolaconase, partial [Flavobacterium sp.]|nr:gluconolaconase [Flavobacterium sp.]
MKNLLKLLAVLIFSISANAQSINFNSNELYPEGIAYSKKQNVFFVSSLHYGKIGKVTPKGVYTEFITDDELVSTIGIHANEKANLLYVCVSDPGVSVKTNAATQMKLAKVNAYDLTTGKRKFSADLGALNPNGGNFANDVDFDNQGNAYVTNSFSPIIYKITPAGKASVFTTSDLFKGEGFNLNGIVVYNNEFLIVAQSSTGNLYKVALKNPTYITKIKADPILGADGIFLNGNNKELLVISNSNKQVYQLNSSDSFAKAKITKTALSEMTFPTTGIVVNKKYFILNAKLDEIFNPKATKTSNFLIQEI